MEVIMGPGGVNPKARAVGAGTEAEDGDVAPALRRGILPRVGPRTIHGPLFRNIPALHLLTMRGGGRVQRQKPAFAGFV
ncbi:hypothetical protein N800_11180 [Lysobacter daejeonensis GH1-9]|uniref:Uncharacterized protein n=1 Tax=Lysobacter daejeonensis GH1-9 TaxID=1385517 RepID=A0A0A0ER22_9GAMM|nr:hypothetical protein N800_11180 [Lysobacter daejeonensis GH1-9]